MAARDIVLAGPKNRTLAVQPEAATGSGIPADCPYWDINAIISHTEIGRMLDSADSYFNDNENDYGKRAVLAVRYSIQTVLKDLYDDRVMAHLRGLERPLLLGKTSIRGFSNSSDIHNTPREAAIEKLEEDMRLIIGMQIPGFFERGEAHGMEPIIDSFITDVDAFIPHAIARSAQPPSIGTVAQISR